MFQLIFRPLPEEEVYAEEHWGDKFIRNPEGPQKHQGFHSNSPCLNVTLGLLFCPWLRTAFSQEPLHYPVLCVNVP